NRAFSDNLGVGDFDLVERAYHQARTERVVRGSLAGSLRKSLFNELRVEWRSQEVTSGSATQSPAVLLLNAVNAGGAQIEGGRAQTRVEIADDLDIAIGRHAIRTGLLVERDGIRSDERRNAIGTFTFADLSAYAAGRPTTFTRNTGDPVVSASQTQTGAYIQDDYRAAKSLTLSGGVRHEYQTHFGGFNLGPRGGFTWSPFKGGTKTVRGGPGVFFDWFDAQTYTQAIQLDGTHQQIQTIVDPGYPNPADGGRALLLPNGRVELADGMAQPVLREANVGVEQQLPGS